MGVVAALTRGQVQVVVVAKIVLLGTEEKGASGGGSIEGRLG